MGKETFSRTLYRSAVTSHVPSEGSVTLRAEQQARETGKLHQLVDPQGYGVIRRSLLRFEQREDGLWQLTIGTSMPVETRVDTTGSMGHNVDVALKVLPDFYDLCSSVLPGSDLHVATGIFGDVCDRFILCRPQFEMIASKIVEQLTLMVPERNGGDAPEDPHYGIFGGAYLVAAYINRIGLKSYDFTVSDAPARDMLDEKQLIRVFGEEVFEKVAQNGHQIDRHNLPSTADVVQDLLKRAHGFFLQVGNSTSTTDFWTRIYGSERVIILPDTELLPQVQSAIIGLTEGTLDLQSVADYLHEHNVSAPNAKLIVRSIAGIPIGAQAALPNFHKKPVKGDLFREKTDLWPIDPSELPATATKAVKADPDEVDWA